VIKMTESNYDKYRRKVRMQVEGAYGDIMLERGRVTKGEMEDFIGQFVEWEQRAFDINEKQKEKLYKDLLKYYKV